MTGTRIAAVSAPRAPLPRELTSFIGRREELAEARALLGSTRLLTVVGPGGVGKSRFAVRLVEAVRRRYEDTAWFFDLSVAQPGGSVADLVATALGLHDASGHQEREVAEHFSGFRGLLVLDSCEHVVDSAAELAARIIEECPGITVVATSRAVLRLSAETVFVIGPLALPDAQTPVERSAVQLYLDRAGKPSLPPGADGATELADIAEICRRLDGLPLAIELAATRARVLTSREVLERLDAPLEFLTRGDRDLPSRQRTVAAAIAWSYELCTDDERSLWRRMSVFAGDWDLAAAERMAGERPGSIGVLDTVESLLEKSVVVRRETGAARYAMLDTVRAFGLEASEADELESVRLRHREHCLAVLVDTEARWSSADQPELLDRTRRLLPDLRLALERCLARGDGGAAAALVVTAWRATWQANGRFDELRRWGERILAAGAPETTELSQLRAVMATVEAAQGDLQTCSRHLEEAEAVAERLGDPLAAALAAAVRAYVDPDPEAKVAGYARSLRLQGGSYLLQARADVVERLVAAYDQLGDTATAASMRASLVARAVRSGERYDTANLLMNAGITALERGESEQATVLLRQSLSLKQGLGSLAYTAITLEALASSAALGHDYERAATVLGSARSVWALAGPGSAFSPLNRRREQVEADATSVLGAHGFDAALQRGSGFSLDDSIAFALGAPLSRELSARATTASGPLTAREGQVAALVAQGLSDREIAEKLVISRRTAEGHVSKSLMKLGFTSRGQLAAWARREAGAG